ncbi:unnamed protein product, partial [Pocillopora meandrina]
LQASPDSKKNTILRNFFSDFKVWTWSLTHLTPFCTVDWQKLSPNVGNKIARGRFWKKDDLKQKNHS